MNDHTEFYVIGSTSSRHSMQGLQPFVGWRRAKDIIDLANQELNREGSFETLAGIDWVESPDGDMSSPSRELALEELLALSARVLEDDGRLFQIFETKTQSAEFIEAASQYGLYDEARALVEHFESLSP